MVFRGEPRAREDLLEAYFGIDHLDATPYLDALSDQDHHRYSKVAQHLEDVLVENIYQLPDELRTRAGEQGLRILVKYLRRGGAPATYLHDNAIANRGAHSMAESERLKQLTPAQWQHELTRRIREAAEQYGEETTLEDILEFLEEMTQTRKERTTDIANLRRTLN